MDAHRKTDASEESSPTGMERDLPPFKEDLPPAQRIAEYLRRTENPRRLQCGKMKISLEFNPDGPPLEDILETLLKRAANEDP